MDAASVVSKEAKGLESKCFFIISIPSESDNLVKDNFISLNTCLFIEQNYDGRMK